MRDPARIRPLLDKLATLWEQHPDWRFGQLVHIIRASHSMDAADIFYIEDRGWEQLIDLWLKDKS